MYKFLLRNHDVNQKLKEPNRVSDASLCENTFNAGAVSRII
jgi:hypothetical protein